MAGLLLLSLVSCADTGSYVGATLSSPAAVSGSDRNELHQRAVALLRQGAESAQPTLKAHAIEALQGSRADLEQIVPQALVDANRGVRFVAAMTVGREKLSAIVHLVTPLMSDSSDSVRAAAMFAQQACGRNTDLSPLAGMLMSEDPEVRGNAAMVLGELGNPSSAPLLRQALASPIGSISLVRSKIIELQLAEALVRVGEKQEIEPIRAALLYPGDQNEIVALGCQIVGRLRDEKSRGYLIGLLDPANSTRSRRPIEVRLAAIAALGQLGNPPAPVVGVVQEGLSDPQPMVRAQAAVAAGHLGGGAGLELLEPFLNDENPLVQIAAARGILEITGLSKKR